ncbi:MAG: DUF302 domain-containing protein [Gammaproteobacteria bacterium]
MFKSMSILLLSLVLILPGVSQAEGEYISKKSPYSVAKTIDRLQNLLKNKGIEIFKKVDHGAGAKRVGVPLNDSQLLIFGNPKMGSPLMAEAPLMGLDLPMKALAWSDASGQVWLSYLDPLALQKRHNLKRVDIIQKMTNALNAFTNQVVQKQ